MSNVNYTQFSEEKKEELGINENVSAFTEEVVTETEEAEEVIIEEPVAPVVEEPKDVIGFVANCSRLNVRKEASQNAAVIKIINRDAKVKIDEENSTEDFYKVQTGGVVGFCMKEFIEVQ